jgi:integrase
MGRGGVSKASASSTHAAKRAANRRAKRPAGVAVVERGGYWHLHGTVRVKRRGIRVRASTGLPALPEQRDAAEELRRQKEQEIRDAILYGIRPSVPFAIAAEQYMTRPRQRPLNAIDVARLQELTRHFGVRSLAAIGETEWVGFVDRRMIGRAPITRERYIDLVMSFLTWCSARPRQWLSELPAFERDHEARDRRDRRARRVGELRPELIALLIEHAAPHLKGQMAILWSTGARVSSVLYGCRLCDYLTAEGREQITFHNTKNGRQVTAAVHPWAAAVMWDYLAWRGRLNDREAPLFLTDQRSPYIDNGRAAGGQMKTAFKGMVKRAAAAWRARALRHAAALRREGQGAAAREYWAAARSDLALLNQLTPHWLRHLLATTMLASGDLRSTMEQGGWLDPRSVLGYSHDVPQRRRAVVAALPAPDPVSTEPPFQGARANTTTKA